MIAGGETEDSIRLWIPSESESWLPHAQVVRNGRGLSDGIVRIRRLRIPLPIPAEPSRYCELLAEREARVYIEAQILHRAVVSSIAGNECLLITADVSREVVGQ